jgi:serine/threonine protein kinase
MNSREFKERYLFDPQRDLIAEGTYSRVFRATDSLLQRDICVKLFRKELIAGSPLIRELNRAGVFFHPNICAFYDLVEIEETNVLGETEIQPIGIIEYMNGGTITDYIAHHRPTQEQVKKFIKDMIRGLSYLHSVGKPHLDVKPGNLLIKLTAKDPVVKITDFLNSENLHTRAVPIAISPQQLCYRAPECFESSYGEQSFGADIWSLGIIVYEMLSGKKLFWSDSDTVEKTIRNVCYTDYWSQVHELPEPYLTFVKKCLVRNVAERSISLEELTLILDGYRPEEPKPAVPAITAVAAADSSQTIAIPAEVMPLSIEIEEAVPPAPAIRREYSAPAAAATDTSIGSPRRAGLSIPIIIGSLLILAGISAFIWRIVDDGHLPAPSAAARRGKMIPAKSADSTGIMARARVVHDTVRVIQIQQTPVSAPFAAPARDTRLAEGRQVNNADIKVKVMPMLPYFNYLFTDKPYFFDLKTPLMSDEEFDLYSENAAITTLGKNTFYVKPAQAGPLDVMVLEKGTHNKIAERIYNVRSKAVPVATIGDDITGGFVSPKMLLAKLTMQAKSESGSYKVKSFRMTCKSGACDIQDASSDNGTFNESMIKFLRNVKSGEELYFDNIIAEDENGQTVKLDPFQLTTY